MNTCAEKPKVDAAWIVIKQYRCRLDYASRKLLCTEKCRFFKSHKGQNIEYQDIPDQDKADLLL